MSCYTGVTHIMLVRLIFFTTVFITGAAVLILEVSAVRLLAPYFGASLYVLSSVLTVILAALSLGYYIGGRLADRMPHFVPLYYIIGAAGILMLFLLLCAQFLLPATAPLFSVISGPLILSLIFFLLPAFLLGIDSPFVIRILTESTPNHSEQGATVGSVFFWSTVGSIVGSISAGFVLIPTLGLTLTIASTALVLILWSCIAMSSLIYINQTEKKESLLTKQYLLLTISAAIMITGILCFQLYRVAPPTIEGSAAVYKSDGFYSSIHIFDKSINGTSYRFLKGDTSNSSAITLYDPKLVFGYTQTISIAEVLVPDAKNFLMLGGGAYTIPRYLYSKYPTLEIDVIELEPELFLLAQTYFELPVSETITNYAKDARVFLQSTSTTYDIFFSDIFNSGAFIPPHLSTVESYVALKARLAPEGIGLINVIGALHGETANLTDSLIKSIASVFPNYQIVALEGPESRDLQNIMIIVRHDTVPLIIPDGTITKTFENETTHLSELVATDYAPHLDSPLLYDNKNATEQLLAKQIKIFKR